MCLIKLLYIICNPPTLHTLFYVHPGQAASSGEGQPGIPGAAHRDGSSVEQLLMSPLLPGWQTETAGAGRQGWSLCLLMFGPGFSFLRVIFNEIHRVVGTGWFLQITRINWIFLSYKCVVEQVSVFKVVPFRKPLNVTLKRCTTDDLVLRKWLVPFLLFRELQPTSQETAVWRMPSWPRSSLTQRYATLHLKWISSHPWFGFLNADISSPPLAFNLMGIPLPASSIFPLYIFPMWVNFLWFVTRNCRHTTPVCLRARAAVKPATRCAWLQQCRKVRATV